jgi:photosystem II stability/assembly factor-like uncharacterized protein
MGLVLLSWGPPGFPDVRGTLVDDLFAVSFPNAQVGWACGRWGTVLHTTDGGKTWRRQQTGVQVTLQALHFVDAQQGWAVGDVGTILHTTDGGRTWQSQASPVPYYLMGVHFVTPLQGWVVTERSHILHTRDGGKSWQVQFHDADVILKAVAFADPLHGWAVGEYGHIYYTADGGALWEKQAGTFHLSEETGEVVADPFLFAVVALDPHTAWAVGIDGYVTRTHDGGRTWQPVETGAPKTHLFGIATDHQGTLLIGGRGTGLLSVDQGQHWQVLAFHPPITYGWLSGVTRRTTSDFMMVGWKGAIYSRDGMLAWRKVRYEHGR